MPKILVVMKNKITILLLILLVMSFYSSSQSYVLNFNDTSTFKISCGKIIPSSWIVKKDSCSLTTPYIQTKDSSKLWAVYTIRVNQSGNLTNRNNAYIQHQINNSPWITDSVYIGYGLDAVASYTDSIQLDTSDYFRIRIIYETDHITRFWQLFDEDIDVKIHKTNNPLPVELLYFNASSKENYIQLKWTTASETNNNFFILQRSTNASNFDSIALIPGNGNSNKTTQYIYNDFVSPNGTLYYRLKQYDYNGDYSYSYIVCAIKKENEQLIQYTLNNSEYALSIDTDKETKITILIYNAASGQIIQKIDKLTQKGNTHIPINELINQPGLYFISTTIYPNRYAKLIPFIK